MAMWNKQNTKKCQLIHKIKKNIFRKQYSEYVKLFNKMMRNDRILNSSIRMKDPR